MGEKVKTVHQALGWIKQYISEKENTLHTVENSNAPDTATKNGLIFLQNNNIHME